MDFSNITIGYGITGSFCTFAKTKLAMDRAEIAIIVFPADGRTDFAPELGLLESFRQKDIPSKA